MRLAIALGLLMASVLPQAGAPQVIDPIGTWTVATTDEGGARVTATLAVTGRPGAYTGEVVTSKGETGTLLDVMSSPAGIIVLFEFPGDRLLLARLLRTEDGSFTGVWGEASTRYAITGTHEAR